MKIQRRRVDVKRHVKQYLVGGRWRSKAEAAKLARVGKIDGVMAYHRNGSDYIQAAPGSGFKLSGLPYVVVK
ncbi:MAG TPA: hypothetical protein VMZ91_05270 [Candidatus Paceibacterota bacterium]|nr:hypothetical protein [Candidatus Paceibacterota bacterium]